MRGEGDIGAGPGSDIASPGRGSTMSARYDALIHTGNVVVDVVVDVDRLPERGSDVFVDSSDVRAGGGFNVMAAAARQGLAVRYAGVLGTGVFARVASEELATEGIVVLQEPAAGLDTGFVIGIVEPDGERTFLSSRGAEATLTRDQLAGVRPAASAIVYVSGYSLMHPSNCAALTEWLGQLPDEVDVAFDPGPFVDQIPEAALALAVRHATWLSCNAREAELLTGHADPLRSAAVLAARAGRTTVIVRDGRRGCALAAAREGARRIAGFAVDVLDTNGAGDCHTGVLLAALATGAPVTDAARVANAAAALSVTARGPATAPTAEELADFLLHRG